MKFCVRKKNPRIEVKFSHLKGPVSNMVIIWKQLTKEADRSKVMEIIDSFKITSRHLDVSVHRHEKLTLGLKIRHLLKKKFSYSFKAKIF